MLFRFLYFRLDLLDSIHIIKIGDLMSEDFAV